MRIPTRILAPVMMVGVIVPVFVLVFMSTGPIKTMKIDPSGISQAVEGRAIPNEEVYPDAQTFQHANPPVWQTHIHQQCEALGMATTIRGNNFNQSLFRQILVDDKNKLLYCQIPKVATTTWRRIFIVLSGHLSTTDLLSLSPDDVHHKYDVHLTYLSDLTHQQILYRLRNYYKFLFVREPLERLLSAFRNKFVTQTKSSDYFRRIFGKKIVQHYRAGAANQKLDVDKLDLKFQEFVMYLVDTSRRIKMNEHWERFHKLCHPCLINYDFIGKLESIDKDSQYLLDKTGIGNTIKFPTRKESKYATHKTDDYMKEYYSKIPKGFIHKLLNEYRADFAIFNYTVPQIMKSLL